MAKPEGNHEGRGEGHAPHRAALHTSSRPAEPLFPDTTDGRPARPRAAFDGPLGALVRFTSDGIVVVNRAGRILFANPTAAAALGQDSVEAVKRVAIGDLLGPFIVEEIDGAPAYARDSVGATRPDREVWFAAASQLLRFRDPAAGWDRWVRIRSRPFVEQSGQHTAFLVVVQDVTGERRRSSGAEFLDQATRRLSQSLLRQRIFEHAAVAAVPRLADECVIIGRAEANVWAPVAWYLPGGGAADRAAALVRSFGPLLVQVETGERPLLIGPSRLAIDLPLSGSMVLVPIKEGGLVTGAMLLAMAADTARCHHPTDLALAEQFADRVAGVLANARLFESEQRRRLINDERLVGARRAAERRDALLVTVAYTLSRQLSPLLSAADLLESSGDPHCLGDVLRRQSLRLRGVVDTLLKASRISAGDAGFEEQLRKIREVLAGSP